MFRLASEKFDGRILSARLKLNLFLENNRMTDDTTGTKKSIRADALRNEDALLEAAKEIFATSGVDAPVREIAARAGVGVGTLYRRFPKRSDLVVGVYKREVDACVAAARDFTAQFGPGDALSHWLKRYCQFILTKKGLAAALYSGDPAFDALPGYFRSNFEPTLQSLLKSAAKAGEIRGDIDAYDLLRAIGNLASMGGSEGAEHTHRMLELMIDGLRFGAANR